MALKRDLIHKDDYSKLETCNEKSDFDDSLSHRSKMPRTVDEGASNSGYEDIDNVRAWIVKLHTNLIARMNSFEGKGKSLGDNFNVTIQVLRRKPFSIAKNE